MCCSSSWQFWKIATKASEQITVVLNIYNYKKSHNYAVVPQFCPVSYFVNCAWNLQFFAFLFCKLCLKFSFLLFIITNISPRFSAVLQNVCIFGINSAGKFKYFLIKSTLLEAVFHRKILGTCSKSHQLNKNYLKSLLLH